MIRHISNSEIDFNKWDKLVTTSKNGTIFCYSWYLSNFCEWDALILDDYKGAMPLPIKTKFGLDVLFQPLFIQQCKWFGYEAVPNLPSTIWKELTHRYSSIHINTNYNLNLNALSRTNLILQLNDYPQSQQLYSKSLRKNLSKAQSIGLTCDQSPEHIETAIQLYKEMYGSLNPAITEKHYTHLGNFLLSDKMKDMVEIVCVKHQNEILASMVFLKSHHRLHYILGAPTIKGRRLNALSFGIDFLVKKFSNRQYILDFEGSNIPSVKKFYESFGSKNEGFFEIEYHPNKLVGFAKNVYRIFKKS